MSRIISESTKKLIAGKQYYKCANKPNSEIRNLEKYMCPLWKINGINQGSFDESGYDIDHRIEFSICHDNSIDNLQALCKSCHSVKTRRFMNNNINKNKKNNYISNKSKQKYNINTVTISELIKLPQIGETIAERIINNRPFYSIQELNKLKGIGPVKYKFIYNYFHI